MNEKISTQVPYDLFTIEGATAKVKFLQGKIGIDKGKWYAITNLDNTNLPSDDQDFWKGWGVTTCNSEQEIRKKFYDFLA